MEYGEILDADPARLLSRYELSSLFMSLRALVLSGGAERYLRLQKPVDLDFLEYEYEMAAPLEMVAEAFDIDEDIENLTEARLFFTESYPNGMTPAEGMSRPNVSLIFKSEISSPMGGISKSQIISIDVPVPEDNFGEYDGYTMCEYSQGRLRMRFGDGSDHASSTLGQIMDELDSQQTPLCLADKRHIEALLRQIT